MGVEALAEVIGITLQNFPFLIKEKHTVFLLSEKNLLKTHLLL